MSKITKTPSEIHNFFTGKRSSFALQGRDATDRSTHVRSIQILRRRRGKLRVRYGIITRNSPLMAVLSCSWWIGNHTKSVSIPVAAILGIPSIFYQCDVFWHTDISLAGIGLAPLSGRGSPMVRYACPFWNSSERDEL